MDFVLFTSICILWVLVFIRLLIPGFAGLRSSRANLAYWSTTVLECVALQLLNIAVGLPLPYRLFSVIATLIWFLDIALTTAHTYSKDNNPTWTATTLAMTSVAVALLGSMLFVEHLLIWQPLMDPIPYNR